MWGFSVTADMQTARQHKNELYSKLVKTKLSSYRHAGDKGRGSIAPTHSWHLMGCVVSVTPRPHFTTVSIG
jgi:hypothetical protein